MNINPQNVLDYPNERTIFMVWNFRNLPAAGPVFKDLCRLMANLNNSATNRFPGTKSSVVMGIGFEAWQALNLPSPLPTEFQKFEAIVGSKHTAVSTRGDLHFHIRSNEVSYCIDAAATISELLSTTADCAVEVHGFRYWDSRSILGFVDGTENPHGADRAHFGIIGDQDPDYEGCSYLFVQKYMHNLDAWKALPVSEQEKVIGRSKHEDIEMPDGIKPTNSHSALSNVGDDHKVIRDNMPFGTVANNDMGTYFIAYASSFDTVKKMLTRMFIGDPPGHYDRILDFSTAHTGTVFFVPSFNMLKTFAE